MGEALITSRVGVIKRGAISDRATSSDDRSISDPALIGARSAVVYTVGEKIIDSSSYNKVLAVIIENGIVVGVVSLGRGAANTFDLSDNMEFDASTGSITITTYSAQFHTGSYQYIVYE